MISTGNLKGQSIHLHISILCPICPWLTHASIALVKTLLIAAPASHPSSTTSARGPSRQYAAQECNNTLNDCSGSSHPSQPIKKTAAAPRESSCSLRWHGWSWCLWDKVCGGWLWRESRHLFNLLCGFCVLLLFCCYGVAKYFLNAAIGRFEAAGCPTNLSHESCIRYSFMLVSVSNVQMSVGVHVCVWMCNIKRMGWVLFTRSYNQVFPSPICLFFSLPLWPEMSSWSVGSKGFLFLKPKNHTHTHTLRASQCL